ncbi:MAG: hypothetical protein WDZ69_00945 [Candidatus Pacearchaeota archaeon]
MAEKETIFSSTMKYEGVFSFRDFYKFCYEWVIEETRLDPFSEEKYEEKIKGNEKDVVIEWVGKKKFTDYFMMDMKIKFEIKPLKEVEIVQGGAKIKTNQGNTKITVKGDLVRDYEGKFEMSAFNKFLRSIYEKWVIKSRIEEYEGKVAKHCDDFLGQAKAYLDLEGKR